MRPPGLEQLVELQPSRIVIMRAPNHDMRQHQAFARPRPAANRALEAVVLDVNPDRDEQDLGRNAIEPERLGAAGERGFVHVLAWRPPALSQNRVEEVWSSAGSSLARTNSSASLPQLAFGVDGNEQR